VLVGYDDTRRVQRDATWLENAAAGERDTPRTPVRTITD
jgi:hypothetical protein